MKIFIFVRPQDILLESRYISYWVSYASSFFKKNCGSHLAVLRDHYMVPELKLAMCKATEVSKTHYYAHFSHMFTSRESFIFF